MKTTILKSLIMMLVVLFSLNTYGFEINGIYYALNDEAQTATVTNGENKYTNDIIIPPSFEYNGMTYSVTSIGESAFQGCGGLTSVTIPEGVVSIGSNSFFECTSLASIRIPESVTYIGHQAFYGCTNLSSISISDNAMSLGNAVFDMTQWYNEQKEGVVYVGNTVYKYKGTMPDETHVEIKEGTVNIAYSAFSYCKGLTSISIPNSVKVIGGRAFDQCGNLTSVTIPNGVTTIGDDAFSGCPLTTVTIPESMEWIGYRAFGGCVSMVIIDAPSLKFYGENAFSGATIYVPYASYDVYKNKWSQNNNRILYIGEDSGSYGEGVTYNLDKTTGVLTFSGQGNMSNRSQYDQAPWQFYMSSIKEVVIEEGVTSIGDYAFYNCSGITSVTIPNSVTSIGNFAFCGCSGLPSVAIPNSVTTIGDYTFAGCSGLPSVAIPNSVTSIGNYAFSNCSGFTSVAIPNSVVNIGKSAFSQCYGLTSIIIGDKITNIPDFLFGFCTSINDVYCLSGDVPTLSLNTFNNSTSLEKITLHVPEAAMNVYKSTSLWNEFGDIVAIKGTPHSFLYMIDGEVYKQMIIEENEEIDAEKDPFKEGYTFSGWSEIPTTMPSNDVVVTGSFIPNYTLTYVVDGDNYKQIEVAHGSTITAEEEPTKEGYTFSGWSEIPATMPAQNITITGSFTINKYKLTYIIDDEIYKEVEYEYGATITSEPQPDGDYTHFMWEEEPDIMPAQDVMVTAYYGTISDMAVSVWDGASDTSWYDDSKQKFHLTNAAQLKGLSDLTNINKLTFENKIIYLDCDIDLDGILWTPISNGIITSETPFKGTFDARGHTITNLFVSSETNPYHNSAAAIRSYYCVGFIGVAQSAVIKNLNIQGKVITEEGENIGLLAGRASKTSFKSISVNANMEIGYNTANNIEIGSVAGSAYESTFYRIKSAGTINTLKRNDGMASSLITKCGGVCGSASSICECEVDMKMKVYTQGLDNMVYVGGCCGSGSVTDAIFTGSLEVYDSWKRDLKLWVGGITASGSVENVVSAPSKFYAESTKPQICVGIIAPKSNSVTNARYVSGVVSNPGDAGTSITRQNLQSGAPIEGFDSDIWAYAVGEYPRLKAFIKDKYKITYIVDGEILDELEFNYGETINKWVGAPWKEGYTFSGWSETPETMPAKDVIVTGTFTVNKYKVTFMYGDKVLTTIEVNYGEAITLPESLNSEHETLVEWMDVPDTMPAHDITIYADYVNDINAITVDRKDEQYIQVNGVHTNELKHGMNIIRTQEGETKKVWVK